MWRPELISRGELHSGKRRYPLQPHMVTKHLPSTFWEKVLTSTNAVSGVVPRSALLPAMGICRYYFDCHDKEILVPALSGIWGLRTAEAGCNS